MPSHAACNPEIKQLYINGHFCYVYKFGMVTNGLGIVRDVSFYNKDFLNFHPEIIVDKKSDSPDEDKSLQDAKAVIPVLQDFFIKHPNIKPNIFIGDAAFDATNIYSDLFTELKFDKAYIPLNQRSSLKHPDYTVNEAGIPYCPHDSTLLMRSEGSSRLKSGIKRFKFVCPKMKCLMGLLANCYLHCFSYNFPKPTKEPAEKLLAVILQSYETVDVWIAY